ncbi:hypothetical protein SLEP1_g44131 [Rubroshorea leprosula]|uniref:Uncharacterized protein n=1 Tax=Rubroshorea leprosula TaxID=152421 RepID=A0AAV5LGE8_9ROSI|nr:hypothetical protein SLEP1_g44131 [Rubroshorea leprosula]
MLHMQAQNGCCPVTWANPQLISLSQPPLGCVHHQLQATSPGLQTNRLDIKCGLGSDIMKL